MATELNFNGKAKHCQPARQGTRFTYRIRFRSQDFTGVVARMQVRPTAKSPDVALELNETNGRMVWENRGGLGVDDWAVLLLDVPASIMSGMPAKGSPKQGIAGYRYDLELVPGGNEDNATAYFFGEFVVMPEVTK